MCRFCLRSTLLLACALQAALSAGQQAAAQCAPEGFVGPRPFMAASDIGSRKPNDPAQLVGVSTPVNMQGIGMRRWLASRARERIVRLFALQAPERTVREACRKDVGGNYPLSSSQVATRVHFSLPVSPSKHVPVTNLPMDVASVRSAKTSTVAHHKVITRTLIQVPVTATPHRETATIAAAPPVRTALILTPPSQVYDALPVAVAFRDSRPFIGMRDLRAAAFEKMTDDESEPEIRHTQGSNSSTTPSRPSNRVPAESKAAPVMLTGPIRRPATQPQPSSRPVAIHAHAKNQAVGRVRLTSTHMRPVDETEGSLLAVPPVPPEVPSARTIPSFSDTSAFNNLELFQSMGTITLGQADVEARDASDELPQNRARLYYGYNQMPQMAPPGYVRAYRPNRNTYPICHQPLYFEDPNLERCGQSQGCLTELCSIAHFAGRIPVLPYLMTAEPPCECVRAKPDCPTCSSFGHDAYFPKPDEANVAAAAVQAAATVGLIFLLP